MTMNVFQAGMIKIRARSTAQRFEGAPGDRLKLFRLQTGHPELAVRVRMRQLRARPPPAWQKSRCVFDSG